MADKKQTGAYLDAVRESFVAMRLDVPGAETGLRWGQFLDTNKPGSKVGLYGAIAAAISFKAGGRAGWREAEVAHNELQNYWTDREKIEGSENNLCQNIRLAALFLGLSFAMDGNNAATKEIAKHLLDHRNQGGALWAESSVDIPADVTEEAEYASALVLIFASCGLHFMAANRELYARFASELNVSALALQKKYINDPIRQRPYLEAMLIAIILILGDDADKKVRRRFKKEFVFSKPNLAARYTHYLDFKQRDGTYGRDYFIAPMDLIAPLLLLQPKLSSQEYLHAVRVTESIKDAVDKSWEKFKGLFVEGVTRPSSVEQGLFVLALEASSTNVKLGPRLWFAISWEFLRRERESGDTPLAWIIILCLYLPFALGSSENILTSAYAINVPRFVETCIGGLSLVPKFWWAATLVAIGAVRKPQDVAKQALGMK